MMAQATEGDRYGKALPLTLTQGGAAFRVRLCWAHISNLQLPCFTFVCPFFLLQFSQLSNCTLLTVTSTPGEVTDDFYHEVS